MSGLQNLPAPRTAGEPIAHIDAINPLTGQHAWRTPINDIPLYSAVLATAGGLLFTGKETGEFIALDMRHRQAAVAVPDRLRHQCAADHVHPPGPAIRGDPVRHRRRQRVAAWAMR